MNYNLQSITLILFMASAAFFQAPAQGPATGIITPGTATTPIKAVAGATGDPTQVICNATPSVVAGVSTMGGYCTTGGTIVVSGTWRIAGSGGPGPGWVNSSNSVTFMLIKGVAQAIDAWQVSANGTIAAGNFQP